MESSHPTENRSRRRHWEWLLLLLALLMSFACIFLSTWFSLSAWPDRLANASMLAGEGANYKRSDQEDVPFGSMNPEVGAEAATDAARLHLTPSAAEQGTPEGIALLPPTPAPSATATPRLAAVTIAPGPTLPPSPAPASPSPTATTRPTSTQTPVSTITPTPVPPPPTDTPTLIPPTPTGTATLVPPTPTETATLVPPPPTDTPTRRPRPPTDTPVPPTDTPVPPTDTPTPTNTPVAPTVLAIRPQAALLGSSVPVTITGSNFESGLQAVLDLGGTPTPLLNLTRTSATTLTADVPSSLPVGMYTLTVTNPGPTNPSDSLANAFQVFTYTLPSPPICSGNVGSNDPTGDCSSAASSPDGTYAIINDPTGVITFDFGSPGIADGPGYDMIFYERANPGQTPPGIALDFVTIEISSDGVNWFTLFSWDGIPGGVVGTNIDSYATDADGEAYNESIPEYDLYPGIPGGPNTGIAMDVGVVGAGPFQYVRVTRPPGGLNEPSEVDAIVQLN